MFKNWKWIAGGISVIGAGIGTALLMQKKIDSKITASDMYLDEAKKYVLENLDGSIKSSYIYKDKENNIKGCISLEKDEHIFDHKFNIINNEVVFI